MAELEGESVDKQISFEECDVCGCDNPKYKCPRCDIRTCSLNCVQIHKKELDCNGDRDKTSYVPVSKFNNLNLLSDYRFLEDVSRAIDNCHRNPLKKSTRYSRQLPNHLFRLRGQALRRKTQLQFLPQHFTRHKENSTYFNFKTQTIYWKIEFVFPQGNHVKISMENCDENELLSKLLSNFLEFENCPQSYINQLKFYHSSGIAGVEVLLKAEKMNPTPSFFLLDKFSTLKENLENRIIVECPVIHVILKSHKDEYNVLDDDLEVQFKKDSKRRVPDFTPFNYYDTISYSKSDKNKIGDEAAASIHSSANELRKYFGCDDETIEDDEESEDEVVVPVKKKRGLDIPCYEDLVKQ